MFDGLVRALQFKVGEHFPSLYSVRIGAAMSARSGNMPESTLMALGRWRALPQCILYMRHSELAPCEISMRWPLLDPVTIGDQCPNDQLKEIIELLKRYNVH